MNRFILATFTVIGLGAAALFSLVRLHTDKIVLTHAGVISDHLFKAAQGLPHLGAVFDGNPAGDRRGGMVLLFDVSELEAAYKSGLTMFAGIITLFDCALFGVPSAAYAVQRTYASQSQKDTRYLAQHGSLTGLLNRGAFMHKANRVAEAGHLYGIAYIDVDRFNAVNDTQGHAAGDLVIVTLAQAMRRVFPENALLAQFGGDEFVIGMIKPLGMKPAQLPQDSLHELRETLALGAVKAWVGVSVSVSVGYAAKGKALTVEEAMARADLAVYSDEMGEALKRRQLVEHLLLTGMQKDRFKVFHQPLVEADQKMVVGYEALLRLTGPDGTIIPPSEFVPIAESLSLINDIGEWVLHRATQEIAQLKGARLGMKVTA